MAFFTLCIFLHELAQVKGLESYKKQNYLVVSPQKIENEAGNYLEKNSFPGEMPRYFSSHDIEDNYQKFLEFLLNLPEDHPNAQKFMETYYKFIYPKSGSKSASLSYCQVEPYFLSTHSGCEYAETRDNLRKIFKTYL